MKILKSTQEYKSINSEQRKIISELLCIDEDLVAVVITNQKSAKPLLSLYEDIRKLKLIKDEVVKKGLNLEYLKQKLGNTIIVGKNRWNSLIKYLSKDQPTTSHTNNQNS